MNYDKLKILTWTERKSSAIINLRNANNFMKSWLIRSFLKGDTVLDVACGKGGDLYKFLNSKHVQSYTGFDISQKLIEIAKERQKEFKGESKKTILLFNANFLDTESWYQKKIKDNSFDFINMQFCIHYFMINPSTVLLWIQVIAKILRKKGRLVITCVDSENLTKKIEKENKWQNSICQITSLPKELQAKYHWKGYNFQLSEAVSDVEFIVDIRYLESQCKLNGLSLVSIAKFSEFSHQFTQLTKDEKDIFELYQYLVFEKV